MIWVELSNNNNTKLLISAHTLGTRSIAEQEVTLTKDLK